MSGCEPHLVRVNMDDSELVDFYNPAGEIIGNCSRSESEDKNYIIANAIIFVFDTGGKVILQKRAMSKKHYPGLWDPSACGAITHGEDPVIAAERELDEEISIRCELTLVEKFMNAFPSEDGSLVRTRFSHMFIGTSDDKPSPNHEVEEIATFELDTLYKMVRDKPEEFVPSFEIELDKAVEAYNQTPASK